LTQSSLAMYKKLNRACVAPYFLWEKALERNSMRVCRRTEVGKPIDEVEAILATLSEEPIPNGMIPPETMTGHEFDGSGQGKPEVSSQPAA
jgi:hypothetical protein